MPVCDRVSYTAIGASGQLSAMVMGLLASLALNRGSDSGYVKAFHVPLWAGGFRPPEPSEHTPPTFGGSCVFVCCCDILGGLS